MMKLSFGFLLVCSAVAESVTNVILLW